MMLITRSRLSSTRDIPLFISFREAMADVQRFDLLDPAEVARFGGIEIVAQGVVEGFLSGIHRSPFRGFSVEFTEHRAYQPGDELRYLDWKILARADRLFVKQFEQETNLRAMILVDASRSMAWRGSPNRLTKRAYADRLAAALALILLRQRDATGLITFDDVVREVVPARVKAGQWARLVRGLVDTPDGQGTAAQAALVRLTSLLARRGLVVLVSDLLFDRELALTALRYLRHRGHQVIVLHTMDPAEAELSGPPEVRYRDPESAASLVVRPRELARAYQATVRPLFPARASGGSLHEPTALAVILDNSPSSGLVVDGRPVLERLKAMARGSLVRATASDRLWLVLADGVARAGTREALLATVDSVGVSARRLDLTAAVGAATRLVDAEPLPAREVHVVSDLQRTALGSGRAAVPRGVRVLALAPPSQAAPNRGVGTVRVTDGAAAVGIVGTPGAGREGGAAPVTLRIRGREVGRALATPGSTVSITLPSLGPGWWVGEVVLDADELRADDRRLLVWRVAPPARVAAPPSAGAGPFVAAALAVLEEGKRVRAGGEGGSDVAIGDRPQAGTKVSVVVPPAEPALIGQVNRALAAGGGRWRFAEAGTPGVIAGPAVPGISGVQVTRRYRIETVTGDAGGGMSNDTTVLATLNGEPWLVRDGNVLLLGSRLDTAWTALPATPAFVPFVDALVNRLVRGEAPVSEVEGDPRVESRTRGAATIGAAVYGLDPR